MPALLQNYQALLVGLLLSFFSIQAAQAQKEVLYSQYLVNPLSINPATAGSRESFHLTASFRRKWVSLRNAPVTQSVSADGAIANGRVGLGFQALNDRMGLFAATGVYGSVAYRFNLPALAKLSIGVQGGVSVVPLYDFASASSLNRAIASFGLGVYYQSDRLFAGISAPETTGQTLDLTGQFVYRSVRPVMVQVGTTVEVSDNAVLIPSILISKIANRPVGVDLNARVWFNEQFGLGVSYRQNSPGLVQTNYVQALAEYQLTKAIRLGYTFNSKTPENPAAGLYFQQSVHEVMFRFSPNILKFTY
ncbi:PorP/SprF family type IX secretion system membrane protein [Spirosoma utsteinense]|uniref:Type IX secretion system PorP/SprF family membrane protein n=1 Tax=Spirosoma utsteinense TaxID=2585773 RepID=A0ABR6W106_9BACT|nr:PorP/SprF family type IX secretion system membrane protein [Spirosoma utsteinense]MBC3786881.1 type IX secretion system PorP/SprF family membrane protein [Spirosoma utsteinense]MBC3789823.1 type IX secretion system PorP/SprF family membrane protein [Spirosoma utsteinense]